MKLKIQSPRQALNKAYLKEKVNRDNIESFKTELQLVFSRINEQESEENLKGIVSDFLKNTYYKGLYEVNTKGRKDLVIHTDKTGNSPVGVIIEVKRPSNKSEMVSEGKPNAKAFHELILYYLEERYKNKYTEIKYIIATNIYEWFIIDENLFEKYIFRNPKLIKAYEAFSQSGKDTKYFYDSIAKPMMDELDEEFAATYFDIRDFKGIINGKNTDEDKNLIALYKVLSPIHLLKQPFGNDSNSLNKGFYNELLYIIGLEETEDGKNLIQRKGHNKRDEGSLIENTIAIIEQDESLAKLENPSHFGDTIEERKFNVALELCITWLNRIIFLKLLEGQLMNYHRGDISYKYLNSKHIHDFNELNKLFFSVLAKRHEDRKGTIKDKFKLIPYLNSSLFEKSSLEQATIDISKLDNTSLLKTYSSTILKDTKGKKRSESLNVLHYVMEFLDSYDFNSEGTEEIKDDNKSLINASVLGLIFEKINGYKEGSFFTPGFITMYMCRESIRRTVLLKFNNEKGWDCKSINDLRRKIENRDEANKIINDLKICDPAVGSGHFLVSALNEIIAIKSDLKILCYRDGRRITDYTINIENDELIVIDEAEDTIFEYLLGKSNKPISKLQELQEALFHEKEVIIENCLFGVDINPNSVKICRLRLWIELLKNSYYTSESKYTELETLPNIDINIKKGNSLISRYSLNEDLSEVFHKQKSALTDYRIAVNSYKTESNKESKEAILKSIDTIKSKFQTFYYSRNPTVKKLAGLRGQLVNLNNNIDLFGEKIKDQSVVDIEKKRIKLSIVKAENEVKDLKENKIYKNAFEWRFEFPEVLNSKGEFGGFDVVIANPPYIDSETMVNTGNEEVRKYLSSKLIFTKGNWDIYIAFFDIAYSLLNDTGNMVFITPDKWISKPFGHALRKGLLSHYYSIVEAGREVFESAKVDSIITFISKYETNLIEILKFIDNNIKNIGLIDKQLLIEPFAFDWLFSENINLIQKLDLLPKRFIEIGECESACATSDTYKLKEYLFDISPEKFDNSIYLKVINTGTIGRYISKWGKAEMTYLKDKKHPEIKYKYSAPVVNRKDFSKAFSNSYGRKSIRPKIIIKGLTLLDACLDIKGEIIPGKSTMVITNEKGNELKFLLALLNSKLPLFYIKGKYRGSSYNQGINFTKDMINQLPVPDVSTKEKNIVIDIVDKIIESKEKGKDTTELEAKIDNIFYELYGLNKDEKVLIDGNVNE